MPAKKEVSNNEILEAVNYIKQNSATKKELGDVLEAVQLFAAKVDQRFDGIDKRFDGVDKRLDGLDKRLTRVESQMVTKEYLDEKIADLRGDLVVMMRKENTKVVTLAEILHKRKLITDQDLKSLVTMEPFAQLV